MRFFFLLFYFNRFSSQRHSTVTGTPYTFTKNTFLSQLPDFCHSSCIFHPTTPLYSRPHYSLIHKIPLSLSFSLTYTQYSFLPHSPHPPLNF